MQFINSGLFLLEFGRLFINSILNHIDFTLHLIHHTINCIPVKDGQLLREYFYHYFYIPTDCT